VVIAGLFLEARSVEAITWNFYTDGDAQGWRAKENIMSGGSSGSLTLLPPVVRDGILRVVPPPFDRELRPAIALLSPPIHHDSGLFDRVQIRFRVVHTRPFVGTVLLAWTNPTNQDHPGFWSSEVEGYRFTIGQQVTMTTEWQEVLIGDLHTGPSQIPTATNLWEGELIDLRLGLVLTDAQLGESLSGPEEVPEAVEIDWIRLTGTEEQLQGELLPPAYGELTFGELFAPAAFQPLERKGIRSYRYSQATPAALGDLDGDGDLDLAATYDNPNGRGWLCAYNDGLGGFSHPRAHPAPSPYLQGGDLDADGRMDILVTGSSYDQFKLLRNAGEDTWETVQEFSGVWPFGWADADGDGDHDLWMAEYQEEGSGFLYLYYNDQSGALTRRQSISLSIADEQYGPSAFVQQVGEDQRTGILWSVKGSPPFVVTYLDRQGEVVQEHLAADVSSGLVRYAGDFDQDGDVDLIVTNEEVRNNLMYQKEYLDLTFLTNQGDGTLEAVSWYRQIHFPLTSVAFFDLNNDGLLDPVVVDGNERSPVVLVSLGAEGDLPVLEGRYPLAGQGGAVVGGDVDNDGDVDLVVLESNLDGQGGVHVLLNRLSEGTTAVAEERTTTLPVTPILSPAYPNPFNASTLIPVSLPDDVQQVSLVIYDLLGQPVKRLIDGPLRAGAHLIRWDGTDDRGAALSSGVYIYRLRAGDQEAVGRVVLAR
jgi:hypothetical protein